MAQPGDVAGYGLVRWLRARGLRWCRHGLLLQAGVVPEGAWAVPALARPVEHD